MTAIVKNANAEEMRALLRFVEWAGPSNIQFAYKLLDEMRLAEHANLLLDPILEALVPQDARQSPTPAATVQRVLGQLVRLPRIDTYNHHLVWPKGPQR